MNDEKYYIDCVLIKIAKGDCVRYVGDKENCFKVRIDFTNALVLPISDYKKYFRIEDGKYIKMGSSFGEHYITVCLTEYGRSYIEFMKL